MPSGFWFTLPRPFFVLAPLAGVTDAAFRRIIATYGKPHVLWTEFISADGLCSPGRSRLERGLAYSATEHPIVAQLYGANPATMERAAARVAALGFDGLDINMGCPDRSVEKRGAGAAMCKQPRLAQCMIRAAQRGADGLPVSVKIRLGYDTNVLDTWLPALLDAAPAAVTIHARTRQEMSKVPAHWDAVAQAVSMRDEHGHNACIIGNGDVRCLAEARQKVCMTGVDGVMFGRAIFGNPWLFNERFPVETVSVAVRLRVMLEHTRLFAALLGDVKSFDVMKKHYKAYVTGFVGARELFLQLVDTPSVADVEAIVREFLRQHPCDAAGVGLLTDSPTDDAGIGALLPSAMPSESWRQP
jgi:nifR3 family TIM-barrel protein